MRSADPVSPPNSYSVVRGLTFLWPVVPQFKALIPLLKVDIWLCFALWFASCAGPNLPTWKYYLNGKEIGTCQDGEGEAMKSLQVVVWLRFGAGGILYRRRMLPTA
jgi:hypothetical protein